MTDTCVICGRVECDHLRVDYSPLNESRLSFLDKQTISQVQEPADRINDESSRVN